MKEFIRLYEFRQYVTHITGCNWKNVSGVLDKRSV